MKRLLSIAVVAGIGVLSGCSMVEKNPLYGEHGIFKDRNQEYEKATVSKQLEIPNHLKVKKTADQLVIPQVSYTATTREGGFEVPRPEFFYAETGSETVNLKKLGDQKVIVVDEPIAAVWEKTLDFMKFNGINIAESDAQKGQIESDWIIQKGPEYNFVDRWIKRMTLQNIKGGTRNKLQISLKPDPENFNRTSILMKHAQFSESAEVTGVDWDKNSRDVAYQSDMMFELLRYMSKASVQPSKRSLLALQQKQNSRPQLGRDARGNPVLKIDAAVDQAWDQLNNAVDAASFDVGTRNQDTGMMYMTYITSTPLEAEKEMGFFEWLFSDREEIKLNTDFVSSVLGTDDDGGEILYSSSQQPRVDYAEGEVQPLADPNNKANQKGYKIWFAGRVIYVFGAEDVAGSYNSETNAYEHVGRYQLKMNRSRSGVFVSVLNSDGLAAPAVISEEILWSIKDNI